MKSLRRILPEIDYDDEKISSEILEKIQITSDDITVDLLSDDKN